MVQISPFKGVTYNSKKIKKIDEVMSPPYDIISTEMQSELYKKNIYNFVRLILGKQYENDNNKNNRYSRAKKDFNQWINDSILEESNNKAIYPYKIEYFINNEKTIMNGFFALLKLDPEYKSIKAHEKTLSKPKADRLNLMRECKANLEPIQLLYIDENNEIGNKINENIQDPILNVEGYDGFIHKLWKIEDENLHKTISDFFKEKVLFIADGHHRYQTAINYADEMKEITKNNDIDSAYNYRMVILVNMFDKGLAILPTHRLIFNKNVNIENLIIKIKEFFNIEEILFKNKDDSYISNIIKNKLKTETKHKFALYTKDKCYILELKNIDVMDKYASDYSKTWRKLDVSILHKLILEKLMDINQSNLEEHIRYTRVDEEAIKFVNEGKYDFSFIMNSTKIEELKAIADENEHMPQKSTYFLPKMLSGLVMYKMDF